ncbi:MAG: hypothetical protein ACOCRX_03585 [Candidatus Woesearchaeota archaeon]
MKLKRVLIFILITIILVLFINSLKEVETFSSVFIDGNLLIQMRNKNDFFFDEYKHIKDCSVNNIYDFENNCRGYMNKKNLSLEDKIIYLDNNTNENRNITKRIINSDLKINNKEYYLDDSDKFWDDTLIDIIENYDECDFFLNINNLSEKEIIKLFSNREDVEGIDDTRIYDLETESLAENFIMSKNLLNVFENEKEIPKNIYEDCKKIKEELETFIPSEKTEQVKQDILRVVIRINYFRYNDKKTIRERELMCFGSENGFEKQFPLFRCIYDALETSKLIEDGNN